MFCVREQFPIRVILDPDSELRVWAKLRYVTEQSSYPPALDTGWGGKQSSSTGTSTSRTEELRPKAVACAAWLMYELVGRSART
jgi:hypothetical protein